MGVAQGMVDLEWLPCLAERRLMGRGEVAWSAYDPLERAGSNEDPLGFYAFALRLAETWLPGITTRTRRARYYSAICGGLLLVEEELNDLVRSSKERDAERSRLMLRWERLWTLAHAAGSSNGTQGYIGSRFAGSLVRRTPPAGGTVDFPFVARQAALGPLGAFRTSLQTLGLLCLDETELTADGRTLGRLFWDALATGHDWSAAARALRTGRLGPFARRGALERLGERLGLRFIGVEERDFLRARLFPTAATGVQARRREVIEYLRARRLTEIPEPEILARAARRGRIPLERRAGAIVAVERYRASLVGVLAAFRSALFARGGEGTVGSLAPADRQAIDLVARSVRTARSAALPWVRSSELAAEIFGDFDLADTPVDAGGIELLRFLLQHHLREMRRRRSPCWFHPAGRDRWALDRAQGPDPGRPEADIYYAYRTASLLTLARDLRMRL